MNFIDRDTIGFLAVLSGDAQQIGEGDLLKARAAGKTVMVFACKSPEGAVANMCCTSTLDRAIDSIFIQLKGLEQGRSTGRNQLHIDYEGSKYLKAFQKLEKTIEEEIKEAEDKLNDAKRALLNQTLEERKQIDSQIQESIKLLGEEGRLFVKELQSRVREKKLAEKLKKQKQEEERAAAEKAREDLAEMLKQMDKK